MGRPLYSNASFHGASDVLVVGTSRCILPRDILSLRVSGPGCWVAGSGPILALTLLSLSIVGDVLLLGLVLSPLLLLHVVHVAARLMCRVVQILAVEVWMAVMGLLTLIWNRCSLTRNTSCSQQEGSPGRNLPCNLKLGSQTPYRIAGA